MVMDIKGNVIGKFKTKSQKNMVNVLVKNPDGSADVVGVILKDGSDPKLGADVALKVNARVNFAFEA